MIQIQKTNIATYPLQIALNRQNTTLVLEILRRSGELQKPLTEALTTWLLNHPNNPTLQKQCRKTSK